MEAVGLAIKVEPHPRLIKAGMWSNATRVFFPLWYLLGSLSHVYHGIANNHIYQIFGRTSLFAVSRELWVSVVMPHITFFALLLAFLEVTTGILILSKGKLAWIDLAATLVAVQAIDALLGVDGHLRQVIPRRSANKNITSEAEPPSVLRFIGVATNQYLQVGLSSRMIAATLLFAPKDSNRVRADSGSGARHQPNPRVRTICLSGGVDVRGTVDGVQRENTLNVYGLGGRERFRMG